MLLYDLTATQPNRSSKRHGGARYGEVVLHRILERNLDVACYYDSSRWVNPSILDEIKSRDISIYDLKQHSLDEIVNLCGANYIYSAVPKGLSKKCPCKLVFTWHGLREEETPLDDFFWKYKQDSWHSVVRFILKKYCPNLGYFKIKHNARDLLGNKNIDFVMVSHHSEKSLRAYYKEAKERDIHVFYSPSTSNNIEIQRKYKENFFLLVSCNRWEKNALRAIMALDNLFTYGYLKDFRVKLTGVRDDSSFRYRLKNPTLFDFLGYVDDLELEQLYHDTYCLIYPSLNEGFGYPPLEAMHYGVPVLASPFTSISEICGDAALYFNPFSIEEIMARILTIVEPEMYSQYSEKSSTRYRLITQKQKRDLDSLIDYMYNLINK